QGRKRTAEALVECQHAIAELFFHSARVVALIDLAIGLKEISNRSEGVELTVGDSIGLHLEATAGALGVEEFIVESGLAGPRLSDDRDHLTLPVAGPLKRPSDRIHLVLAPHEPSESSARGSLKALARRLGIDQLKHIYGLSETPDRYEPQR